MYRLILIWFYYILNWFIAFSFITIYYHLQYLLLHHLLQVAIKEHLLLFIPFITNCVLHLLPFIPFIPFITGATWRYRLYLILPQAASAKDISHPTRSGLALILCCMLKRLYDGPPKGAAGAFTSTPSALQPKTLAAAVYSIAARCSRQAQFLHVTWTSQVCIRCKDRPCAGTGGGSWEGQATLATFCATVTVSLAHCEVCKRHC